MSGKELLQSNSLFARIQMAYEETESAGTEIALPVYEKIWWALSHLVFPEGKCTRKFPCYLRDDGLVYEEITDVYDIMHTGEYILHECLGSSPLEEYAFVYYNNSPYWDYTIMEARIDNYILTSIGLNPEKECYCGINEVVEVAEDFELNSFTEDFFDSFFEYAAVELMDVKDCSPFEYFVIGDGETAQDCVMFKSYLLPYYLKLDKSKIKKSHKKYVNILEKGISIMQNVFNGGAITIMEPELEAAYFVSFCGCCYQYSYRCTPFDLKYAVLLAGKIIDDAIILLNKYYHFVPEEMIKGGS